ncbi:FixH family protein [Bosea sp. 117]|uniref:FixH family protein n=1 Tax=Bosea sp. 117 TaxID=1125973 RepID=UPI00068B9C39|nr:FixH family protein [Bosea sp. 117]
MDRTRSAYAGTTVDAIPPGGRPITGRTVLVWFVGFFAVVFAANFFLVRAAITSFGGVETESAYQAGVAFKGDEAAAARQASLNWNVTAHVTRDVLEVRALDADGEPLAGLDLVARLHHPTDRRFDVEIETRRTGPGEWRGVPWAGAGQWELVIDLSRDGERQFRSMNRVVLK